MNLFFYVPRPEGRRDELLSAVAPFVSGGSLEVFADIGSFGARVRRPKDALSIALIWNPTKEELQEIVLMRDFLVGVHTLLALPNQEADMIALAHRIFPTYITYIDGGISEIVSVLERLTRAGRAAPARRARL